MDKDYSISMRRSRHGKRSRDDENNGNNSESVTGPNTALPSPTFTVTIVQTTVTSTVAASVETSAQIPVFSETPDSGTMRKRDATLMTSAVPSSPSGLPVGAVAGIVLAVILLLVAGSVFWFRRRSIASRMKEWRRDKQQQKALSFLFIEPQDSSKVSRFHVTLQPYHGRDISVPVKMTKSTYPHTAYPAPPRPPPMAGMYDSHTISTMPLTPSSSIVSINHLSSPSYPNLTASPSPQKQAETTKVHATFIPTLPDELTISIGEMVRIHIIYDDGWGLCSNARGEMGMLPLECLDMASPRKKSVKKKYRRSARASSLSATPRSPYGENTPM